MSATVATAKRAFGSRTTMFERRTMQTIPLGLAPKGREHPYIHGLILALAVLLVAGCEKAADKGSPAEVKPSAAVKRLTPEAARMDLAKLGKDYSVAEYLRSADNGDTVALELYLAAGMDVDVKDEEGLTALMRACNRGQKTIAALLIAHKANKEEEHDGMTPLMLACLAKQQEIAALLLANKANIEAAATNGATALIVACSEGHQDIAALLLAHKANLGAVTTDGNTPLRVAIREKHYSMVEFLLRAGALHQEKVSPFQSRGSIPTKESILVFAAKFGTPEMVSLLLRAGANPYYETTDCYPSLADQLSSARRHRVCDLSDGISTSFHEDVPGLALERVIEPDPDARAPLSEADERILRDLRDFKLSVKPEFAEIRGTYIWEKEKQTLVEFTGSGFCIQRILLPSAPPLLVCTFPYRVAAGMVALISGTNAFMRFTTNGQNLVNVKTGDRLRRVVSSVSSPAARSETTLERAFLPRVLGGHLQSVKKCLAGGVDPNTKNTDGWSALMCASVAGKTEIVKLLLEHGALVDAKDLKGDTALLKTWDFDVAKVLLDHGANTNGFNPLVRAAAVGNAGAVKLLLDKGAAVDAFTSLGGTALNEAAGMDSTGIVELLLAKGASIDLTNKHGRSALAIAARQGATNAARVLLEHGANRRLRDEDHHTALEYAQRGGHAGIVRMLSGGYEKTSDKKSPAELKSSEAVKRLSPEAARISLTKLGKDFSAKEFIISAENGDSSVVELFLATGMDADAKDEDGLTALVRACTKGHKRIVEILLANKANIEGGRADGFTPMMAACLAKQQEIVGLLITNKANIESATTNGATALIVACSTGRPDIAALLLAHKANPGAVTQNGDTPLKVAIRQENSDMVELLIKAGALQQERITPFQCLGSKPTAANILFDAAMSTPHIVKLLLLAGANPYYETTHADQSLADQLPSAGRHRVYDLSDGVIKSFHEDLPGMLNLQYFIEQGARADARAPLSESAERLLRVIRDFKLTLKPEFEGVRGTYDWEREKQTLVEFTGNGFCIQRIPLPSAPPLLVCTFPYRVAG
ncbi:MAG: ankyrin repeat domain-containing protein, partial [Verrucomicrobiota bacterium]